MTATREELVAIMAPVKHVLLDFDGPVCSVFAGFPAREVTQRMRERLAVVAKVPPEWAEETDPLSLLRQVEKDCPQLVVQADDILVRLEIEAVSRAVPTPCVRDFLKDCADKGQKIWVVSNNAERAISSYLEGRGLMKYVAGVYGRIHGDPSSMKPSPRLLTAARIAASAQPFECIFIGDAVRDVQAADAATIRAIGYANKPGKEDALAEAGALAVVTSMGMLLLR